MRWLSENKRWAVTVDADSGTGVVHMVGTGRRWTWHIHHPTWREPEIVFTPESDIANQVYVPVYVRDKIWILLRKDKKATAYSPARPSVTQIWDAADKLAHTRATDERLVLVEARRLFDMLDAWLRKPPA